MIINTFKLKQGKIPLISPHFSPIIVPYMGKNRHSPFKPYNVYSYSTINTVQMRYHKTIFDQVENFMILQILPPFYPHRGVKIANLPNKVCTYSYSDINVA